MKHARRMKYHEANRSAVLALKEAFTIWKVKENTTQR